MLADKAIGYLIERYKESDKNIIARLINDCRTYNDK